MYEMKFKEMQDAITQELIKEHGQAFLNLSRNQQCAMITHKFIDILEKCRERQA